MAVSSSDLPSEARVHLDVAASHDALVKLLEVKDAMIWHLLEGGGQD